MKVQTPRGRGVTWAMPTRKPARCSEPHRRARGLLAEQFPTDLVYEEVPVPGTRLRFDFVIPKRRLCVEVQGVQHSAYTPRFHGSRAEFLESLRRDAAKVAFCEANSLILVALEDSETYDCWREQLQNAQGSA